MHPVQSSLFAFLALYALLYGAFGVQSPFLPDLLRVRELHPDQIGLVLGASTAIRVIAGPVVGHAADRAQRHSVVLCGCALAAAFAGLGYVAMRGVPALLPVALIHAALLAPIVPLSDALATVAANRSGSNGRPRFDYGWLRATGSGAFIVGTTIGGWIAGQAGLVAIPWASSAVLAMGGAAALLLPAIPRASVPSVKPRVTILRDGVLLLRIPVYRRMLIVAALIEGSHALQDSFAVIRWHVAGIDLPTISILWSESVASEVLVFLAIGPRLVSRFGPGWCCALAAGAGAVRWATAAATTSPIVAGFTQPLHGLTFALLHLACMRLIVEIVPIRLAATAQSIYGTLCIGLATALLTVASGVLYERMNGHAFLVMAALCLAAAPMCHGLRLRQRRPTMMQRIDLDQGQPKVDQE